MAKQIWKAGNMLYPVPAVMVSVADSRGNYNIITVAWTGTVCTNPPMVSISVRPERYSYHMLEETGEFVINLTTRELVRAADYCGVRSGRDVDKFRMTRLTPAKAERVCAPLIQESPVNLECRVVRKEELGSHHLFLAEVLAVQVDEAYLDEKGRLALEKAHPIVYSHGEYYGLGPLLGSFGYSVRKAEPGKGNETPRPVQERGGAAAKGSAAAESGKRFRARKGSVVAGARKKGRGGKKA